VAIVVYAGAAGLVLPPTSGSNKQAILGALEQLEAGGSTAGGAGIQLAYNTARSFFNKEGNNRVILATDGDFNVGVSSDGELVRMIEKERESGIFLSVLGFGMGNYKDNKLQLLADKGNGNHAYIDNMQEARKVLVTQFGGTLFTIAKDVKIQIEFNPDKIAGYRLVGYENRLLANEDFKDDTKDAGELGAGHTVTALYEIIPAGTPTTLLADIDPLKYQAEPRDASKYNNEFVTIKLRHKMPQGTKSTEMVTVVNKATKELDQMSENFRWASAVASLAQMLRQSEFKGDASLESILAQARGASTYDQHGYRHEFIGLVMTLKNMGTYGSVEK
jgi:Ca-activated chloride channel family protein